MILQALKEYYDRKVADPDSDIAPEGFERKEIPFVIVLDSNGQVVDVQSTYEGEGKAKRARAFLVPHSEKRSVGIVPNFLWDNPAYALGIDDEGKEERVKEQHAAFVAAIEQIESSDVAIEAVRAFLAIADKRGVLSQYDAFRELVENGANLTFKLAGSENLVLESQSVKDHVARKAELRGAPSSLCLVTGEPSEPARLHPPIKGVWGAQTTGANIVSFNQAAFASYGKKQGANAPVGKTAAFAYVTALNNLLGKDSKQRMQVGDASTVFWSAKACDFENQVTVFFSEPPKDDPDRNVRAVERLFKAVRTGSLPVETVTNKFYVLGLAPNASRISIRFWIVDTVHGMSGKICQHFEDTRIAHGPKDRDCLSLFRLLVNTAVQGKADNIPPNIGGETMRAIFSGLQYPQTLFQAAVRRSKAEREVNYERAAIIKACLNRMSRFNGNKEEVLQVSLDIHNTNIGYRLGRLFAVLEKIQQEASPGINATIRDKFYGAASGTPVTVFGNLMRLKNHHLAKLENQGRRVNLERLIGEIMEGVTDFPAHLNMEDQGRFAIGYYHQMQDFYTKKAEKTEQEGK